MLVNQPLYHLTIEHPPRFRARQVIQYIIAKYILSATTQYYLVEVRMRCFVQYFTLLVDYFGVQTLYSLFRVRDQFT